MALMLQGLLGLVLFPLIAWIISEDRSHLDARRLLGLVAVTLALQFAIALLLLKAPWTKLVFDALGGVVFALQRASDEGARLLFGYLAGGPAPFDTTKPENGYLVAFRVLPIILVLSALVKLFYHWGVLQRVVAFFAWGLKRTVGTGGPLGTVAAASLFLGLVEAPLMIRPYLREMGRGALFAAMACTMATVAGTVMALYASILQPVVPGAAGHLLAASLMNVPAALLLARIAVPAGFEGGPDASGVQLDNPPRSSMDAVVQGTVEGIHLVVTVAAMLIVIVSLVALANSILALAGEPLGATVTLQRILGIACAPLAFVIGIPWSESAEAGALLGQKVVLNEFLAYLELVKTPESALSDRSRLIITYALCGFANLGSLGILIGALTAMAPERREEIVALAPRSVLVGFMATLMSAAIVGIISGL